MGDVSRSQLSGSDAFVASDPDDPDIAYAIEQLGDECIVTATDFGHPEGRGYMQTIDETLALDALSEQSRRRIMWDNPVRLYGLV